MDAPVLERGGHGVVVQRANRILPHILFAGPDDLDGAVDLLGDAGGDHDHVDVEPPAECTAEHVVVDLDLLARDPERLGGLGLAARLDLGAEPELATAGRHMGRAVERLHRRMGKEGQLICCFDPLTFAERLRRCAGFVRDNARLAAVAAQAVPEIGLAECGMGAVDPVDLERAQAFQRRPHIVADDRDQIVEHDHLPDARERLGGGIVDRAHLAADRGRGGERRDLHLPGNTSMP
jgi:hypothetical protein